jgi:hypothetical protein
MLQIRAAGEDEGTPPPSPGAPENAGSPRRPDLAAPPRGPPARALLLFNLRRDAREPYMKELARSKMGPNCITSSGKGPFRKIFFYVTYSRTRFKEGLTEINHLFQNYNAYFYGIDVWLKVFIL